MGSATPDRRTAMPGGDVTVFLIGMRFNRPWRADRWAPVFTAFPRMLRHLASRPESGLLSSQMWIGPTTLSLQYWRSPEHLRAFAADPGAPHLQPWRDFTRLARDGHVGIWHETYLTTPAGRESVYVEMPDFGLGKALGTRPIDGSTASFRKRLAEGATG